MFLTNRRSGCLHLRLGVAFVFDTMCRALPTCHSSQERHLQEMFRKPRDFASPWTEHRDQGIHPVDSVKSRATSSFIRGRDRTSSGLTADPLDCGAHAVVLSRAMVTAGNGFASARQSMTRRQEPWQVRESNVDDRVGIENGCQLLLTLPGNRVVRPPQYACPSCQSFLVATASCPASNYRQSG